MKVYLAGPMTGIPLFNFPAFMAAAADLEAAGLHVFNPAQNDLDHGFDPADYPGGATGNITLAEHSGFSLREALGQDLAFICHEADAVALLPGWENSKGAAPEVAAALALGLFVWEIDPDDNSWANERGDVMRRYAEELQRATGDGSKKRQAGLKPPWYRDPGHEGAIFSHLTKWKRGEKVDPDSGAHPLVHAAWRCLAIACIESGNTPS